MLKPIELQNGLYYLGVNDRSKEKFENLWLLPKGVSYNSYLIVDEKTVLMDTVDICYSDVFFTKLEASLGNRMLDYVVINHMEPDHSGSLRLLKNKFPNLKIVGNKRTLDMVQGYYNIFDNLIEIKDSDELEIGARKLKFFLTPMVHWPETMMTLDTSNDIIFTGDAFGTFGTLDGGVTDETLNIEQYWDEMIRYYSNIIGKFGSPVQKALEKIKDIKLNMICSTHGPIWTRSENIEKVTSLYNKLSQFEAETGVVIAYGSMYGNTEQMAEAIARGVSEKGIKNIIIYNLSKTNSTYILRDIYKYNALVIGSPTYNNQLYPPVQALISKIEGREIKNRFLSFFGSYTWAGAAVRHLNSFAEKTNMEIIGSPIEMKQSINNDIFDKCIQLGHNIAEKLLEEEKENISLLKL